MREAIMEVSDKMIQPLATPSRSVDSSSESSEPPLKVLKSEPGEAPSDSEESELLTLRTLVELGASIDCEDEGGLTPLFWAVRRNDLPLVRRLVTVGADVNYPSATDNLLLGGTALHHAAAQASVRTVKELLDLGAEINREDHYGKTALHWAAWTGRLEVLRLLVERGGDLTAEDSWDRGLLHMAADGGHADVAEYLLGKGADPRATCSQDNTPLHCAAIGGHLEVMRLLLGLQQQGGRGGGARGVGPDPRDILGRTPLMCAVRNGQTSAVKLLLRSGAAVRNKDHFGVSVVDWSFDLESSEIPDILNRALNGESIDD